MRKGERLNIIKIRSRRYFITLQGRGYYIQGKKYWYIWAVNDEWVKSPLRPRWKIRCASLAECKEYLLEMEAKEIEKSLRDQLYEVIVV